MSRLRWGVDVFTDIRRLGLKKPKVIMDVGAHFGESALAYASRFPAANIFAFEPEAKNYQSLVANVAGLSQISCTKVAMGDREGRASIYGGSNSEAYSLKPHRTLGYLEEVDVTTIDRFLFEKHVEFIDFLKVDTEGHEMEVLKGAKNSLAKGKINLIFAEATFNVNDEGEHTQLSEIQSFLSERGLQLISIYDQHIFPAPSRLGYFNALFARAC